MSFPLPPSRVAPASSVALIWTMSSPSVAAALSFCAMIPFQCLRMLRRHYDANVIKYQYFRMRRIRIRMRRCFPPPLVAGRAQGGGGARRHTLIGFRSHPPTTELCAPQGGEGSVRPSYVPTFPCLPAAMPIRIGYRSGPISPSWSTDAGRTTLVGRTQSAPSTGTTVKRRWQTASTCGPGAVGLRACGAIEGGANGGPAR